MKALVYEGHGKIELKEVKDKALSDDEVKVNVKACGICGSDVHGYLGSGRRIAPMIMGHEFSGIIVETGDKVKNFKTGDKVIVYPVISCGKCSFCKNGMTDSCKNKKLFGVMDVNGAMAEYINVNQNALFRIPDGVDFVDASLAEPLAVACGAVNKIADNERIKGMDVLIVGSGTIGLMLLQVLSNKNPHRLFISDISDRRLSVAMRLGAIAINPESVDIFSYIKEMTGGKGIELSFEAVGITKTVEQAVMSLGKKGTSIWIGNFMKIIEIDMQHIVTNELSIAGSYAYSFSDFKTAVDLLAENSIDSSGIVTDVEDLSRGAEVFQRLASGDESIIKAVLIN